MSQSDEFSNNRLLAQPAGSLEEQRVGFAGEQVSADTVPRGDWAARQLPELDLEPSARYMGQRLAIKTSGRLVFLDSSEIDWVEACGNYVKFHAGLESYLTRAGIGQIARKLNPGEFVRIHRSAIVHVRKIKELQPGENGEYRVTLKNGKQLSCSRSYIDGLQELVRNYYSI